MGALAPEVEAAEQEDGAAVAGGDVVTTEVVQVLRTAVSDSSLYVVAAVLIQKSNITFSVPRCCLYDGDVSLLVFRTSHFSSDICNRSKVVL